MNNGEGKESGLKGLKPVASSLVSSSTLSLSPVNTSHITSIFSSLGIFLISMPVPLCPSPPLLCLIHLVPQLTKLFAPFILRFNNSVAKKHMQCTLKEWFFFSFFFLRKVSPKLLKLMAADKNAISFIGRKDWVSSCTWWLKNSADEQFAPTVKTLMILGLTTFSWKTKIMITQVHFFSLGSCPQFLFSTAF